MKDARGYGSNKRGTTSAADAGSHQTGVLRIGRPMHSDVPTTWDVELRQAMGYQTQAKYKNPTVAERQAQLARVDQRRYGGGQVKLRGDMVEGFRRQRESIAKYSGIGY